MVGKHKPARPVRQADVAAEAGVSTATVSRVLNGSPLVSSAVRARVEAVIARIGYLPNEGARSLATRRSGALGAIVPTLENAIFAAGLNAFEAGARERGFALVIAVSNYDPAREAALIAQMVARGVEGLLLVGNDRAAEAGRILDRSGVRHCCAWTHDAAAGRPNIGFDNAAAMAPVVDRLVAGGRRRIALLMGRQSGNDRARDRLRGARARLRAHGLEPVAVAECRYSPRRAGEAFEGLRDARPDAVVCGNDVIAFGVLSAARRAGIGVPGDLAVTGFDDLPLSAEFAPALTTVRVPARRMCRAAAVALTPGPDEDGPVASALFGTELVVRESA
ncbi:MAG: LacI family DNA-binding transcriptional regulator [Hasllibacter sp.]